ncbi:hypothetical protein R3W88_023585 [Solanum pinnatisectum]|uniref:RRM domain-containing protein n=1 Tax=Solanum pinnatisectum TaxID=50273 RepID=A0AAV9LY00_9SOLN|nr:hypothetical protein R3W88_023585 [Solanum pinnatisectum]
MKSADQFNIFVVILVQRDARVIWDQKTGRSRGFGFVSFRNQQEAQSTINDLNGKWLGSRQIRCNWAAKSAGAGDGIQSLDAKSVVELTRNIRSLQLTSIVIFMLLGLVPLKMSVFSETKVLVFVRYNSHAEAARAI